MSFEHVQSQQHVHGLFLEDGEGGGEEIFLYAHLHHMDTADDPLNSDTLGYTRPPSINRHNILK